MSALNGYPYGRGFHRFMICEKITLLLKRLQFCFHMPNIIYQVGAITAGSGDMFGVIKELMA